jgi:hypothetical protein
MLLFQISVLKTIISYSLSKFWKLYLPPPDPIKVETYWSSENLLKTILSHNIFFNLRSGIQWVQILTLSLTTFFVSLVSLHQVI